jgi:hypothetical protein
MAIDTEPESTSVIRSSFGPGGTANEKGRLWTIHGDFGNYPRRAQRHGCLPRVNGRKAHFPGTTLSEWPTNWTELV